MSAISTYLGLETTLKQLTILATIVISCGLLACDIAILNWRQRGYSLLGIILLLFLFASFSGISHFNFFYTNFMRDGLAQERVAAAKVVFDTNMTISETLLDLELQPILQNHAKIRTELEDLRKEVDEDKNRGFGQKALDRIKALQAALQPNPVQEPKLPPTGASKSVNDDALKLISERVSDRLKEDLQRHTILVDGKKYVSGLRLRLEKITNDLPPSPILFDANYYKSRITAIQAMQADVLELERRIGQIFQLRNKTPPKLTRPVGYDGIELNTFKSSIESASRPENNLIGVMLAILSVVIDLIPLLFALVFVRPAPVAPPPVAKEDKGIVFIGKS